MSDNNSSPLRSPPPTPIKVSSMAKRGATINETDLLLLFVDKYAYRIDVIGKIGLKSAALVKKRYFELRESLSTDRPLVKDAEATEDSENGSEDFMGVEEDEKGWKTTNEMTIQELHQMAEEVRAHIEAAEAELRIRAEIAAEDAAEDAARDMVFPIRGGRQVQR